jgi:hypothetical protein
MQQKRKTIRDKFEFPHLRSFWNPNKLTQGIPTINIETTMHGLNLENIVRKAIYNIGNMRIQLAGMCR